MTLLLFVRAEAAHSVCSASQEYAQGNDLAYKYTSYCVKYRAFAQSLKRSMRQTHLAGEKLFVDYAGQTVSITDATTGEISAAAARSIAGLWPRWLKEIGYAMPAMC